MRTLTPCYESAERTEDDWPSVALFEADALDWFGAIGSETDPCPPIQTLITDPPWRGQRYLGLLDARLKVYDPHEDALWVENTLSWWLAWLIPALAIVKIQTGQAFLMTSMHHLPQAWRACCLAGTKPQAVWYGGPDTNGLIYLGRPLPTRTRERIERAFTASGYPARKPAWFIDRLLDACDAGMVLDPFCGHGSVLVAARTRGYPVIGIDQDRAALAVTQQALEGCALCA